MDGHYQIGARVHLPYDRAVPAVRDLLKAEGFGVLTEIDVQHTLKQKLGVDFRRYMILGACNPPLAHRALNEDLEIGLLLPCNVIVYEDGEDVVVSVLDPVVALGIVGNTQLAPVAAEARARLERAIQSLRQRSPEGVGSSRG
jgi:uncharacterized protein (DUF302 family)